MASMSKEEMVFLDVLARLTDEVALDPSSFATKLYRQQLIPRVTWQKVLRGGLEPVNQANEMMISLETKIAGDAQVMYKLVAALREIPHMASLADEIHEKLNPKSQQEPVKPAPTDLIATQGEPVPSYLNYAPTAAELADRVGWQVSAGWKKIARHLGLEENDIASIEMQERGSPEDCMARAFDNWYRRNRKPYTWAHLIMVLEKQAVGYGNVAAELRKELPNNSK